MRWRIFRCLTILTYSEYCSLAENIQNIGRKDEHRRRVTYKMVDDNNNILYLRIFTFVGKAFSSLCASLNIQFIISHLIDQNVRLPCLVSLLYQTRFAYIVCVRYHSRNNSLCCLRLFRLLNKPIWLLQLGHFGSVYATTLIVRVSRIYFVLNGSLILLTNRCTALCWCR